MNSIYKMKLHSSVEISPDNIVMRIPGGWIYITKIMEYTNNGKANTKLSSVFVPFNNEFENV